MNRRHARSAVASLLVASVCTLTLVHLTAQSRRGTSSYSAPRTAWGDPDIQGFWSYNDDVNTPFERPGELSGKVEFGDEELAAGARGARATQRRTCADDRWGDRRRADSLV